MLSTQAAIQQGEYYYVILSQSMLDGLTAGGAQKVGMSDAIEMGPIKEVSPLTTPWTGLDQVMQELMNQKLAFKGNSYKELAAAAGMDKTTFSENMASYQEASASGKDTWFFKPKEHLVPLGAGPYYAVRVEPYNLASTSGVRVDENLRVVDEDYRPVQGLYAAGSDATGIFGDSYALVEGAAMGWAWTSGRLAAQYAAKEVLGK